MSCVYGDKFGRSRHGGRSTSMKTDGENRDVYDVGCCRPCRARKSREMRVERRSCLIACNAEKIEMRPRNGNRLVITTDAVSDKLILVSSTLVLRTVVASSESSMTSFVRTLEWAKTVVDPAVSSRMAAGTEVLVATGEWTHMAHLPSFAGT